LTGRDKNVRENALKELSTEVKTATTSMTSIPKPLKFIGPHYEDIIEFYDKLDEGKFRLLVADFLSVMSMTMAKESSK